MHGDDPKVVEAVGKASEALEYVERARGHLYSFHQLMGRADIEFGNAADLLREAGLSPDAASVRTDVVGRNVLDGRWTFQVVDEFDELYYRFVVDAVRALERAHLGGRRHVFESNMKDDRQTHGRAGQERRPPAGWSTAVDTGGVDPGHDDTTHDDTTHDDTTHDDTTHDDTTHDHQ
jgi:hypothetical protein